MYRDVWTIHFSHVSYFVLSGALIIFSVYLFLNIALDIKSIKDDILLIHIMTHRQTHIPK